MSKLVKGIIGGDDFITEILVRGLTINGPVDAYCVTHCNEQLGSRLSAKCGVGYIKNYADVIPNSAILFLAFDQEEAPALLPRIAEKINDWTLIVSVVTNLKLTTLEYFFSHNEIVRLVVNPSIVTGRGLGAYALSKNASTDANSMAEIVLKECGDVIAVKDEQELETITDFIYANTYLSYVVIQTMIKNARKVGMLPKEASFAVDKLLRGSMRTLIDFRHDTADIISRGLSEKEKIEPIGIIKKYGIDTDLMKELTNPEPAEKPNPNDDPKNFRMHYQWSGH